MVTFTSIYGVVQFFILDWFVFELVCYYQLSEKDFNFWGVVNMEQVNFIEKGLIELQQIRKVHNKHICYVFVYITDFFAFNT